MDMDLNAAPPTVPEAAACTICLDPVVVAHDGARSVALLLCGHKFHLDCIGSAFNAKGIMQCPNCRNTENCDWLTASRFQPSTDFGNGVMQSPFHGPALDSMFQNRGLEPISSGMEGDPSPDLSNVQVVDGTVLQMVDLANRSTSPFGFDVPRYDSSNQQRSTQRTPQSRSSSVVPLGSSPAVTSIGHGHGLRGHVVQRTVPPATRSSPYPQTAGRIMLRALSMSSFIAASYTAEDREPHDISRHDISRARAAHVQNNNISNQDDASRRADQP